MTAAPGLLDQLLAEPGGREGLVAALAARPELLAEALDRLGDKRQLQRVAGNPNRLLPIEPAYAWPKPPFDVGFGNLGLKQLIEQYEFASVLDVGAGAGRHARVFQRFGKQVTKLDFGLSIYATQSVRDGICSLVGDINRLELDERFDCVWASHVLEHQPDANHFLRRLVGWCRPGGVLAISVPPAKFDLVGGHVSLWTPGHLLYNLVLAGVDCAEARLLHYGYNITAFVRNRPAALPELHYDNGDITRLKPFLPPQFHEGVDGFAVAERP